MATINDLKTSISELPRNDVIQLLLTIRHERRENIKSKAAKKKSAPKRKKAKKAKKDFKSALRSITPEQAKLLLQQLNED